LGLNPKYPAYENVVLLQSQGNNLFEVQIPQAWYFLNTFLRTRLREKPGVIRITIVKRVRKPTSIIRTKEIHQNQLARDHDLKMIQRRHKARSSKKNKIQPSEDALQLSAKLKEFSRNKNLGDALKEYWHESNDKIRDGHHACIMVDCSARCGKISVRRCLVRQI
jgi:hypothetical protein